MSTTQAAGAIPRALARRRPIRRQQWAGLLFVLPAVALVVVFFVVPLAMTAWMSLHNWPLMGVSRFIGLDNYLAIARDTRFWNALRFTALYTVVVTIAIFAAAFPLALFVEKPRPLRQLLPHRLFPARGGRLRLGQPAVGLAAERRCRAVQPRRRGAGTDRSRVNLLADFDPAFWSIIAMVVWKVAGFTMVILMTGLQGIPADYLEAAKIDGAGPWARFRRITLPLMRRTIALALILSVTGSMLAFDQFYIILGGGPRNQTVTAVYWIFNQSFVSFRLGYGAALSMVLLAILLVLSVIQLRLLRHPEGE